VAIPADGHIGKSILPKNLQWALVLVDHRRMQGTMYAYACILQLPARIVFCVISFRDIHCKKGLGKWFL
jgi:hypothetical protein